MTPLNHGTDYMGLVARQLQQQRSPAPLQFKPARRELPVVVPLILGAAAWYAILSAAGSL